MDGLLIAIIGVIVLALVFDFTNGFHDAANSVATVVATRALPARWAPWFSAVFNFSAFFVVGTAVANTVAKVVKHDAEGVAVVFAALIAAITWNYVTWYVGMPSSSSHAIIGGLVGAGLAAGGLAAINWGVVQTAVIAIVVSPAVAFTVAFLAMVALSRLQRRLRIHDDAKGFKALQLVSAAAVSFGHGANDAQKTMGIMAAALLAGGYITLRPDGSLQIDWWIPLLAYSAIAAGTVWGGWKIIETMGLRITTLRASSGLAANIGAVTAIFGATGLGIPISTTHAAATSITGSGVASGQGVNLRVVLKMVGLLGHHHPVDGRHRVGDVPADPAPRRGRLDRGGFGPVRARRVDRLGHGPRGARLRHRRRDPHRRGASRTGVSDPAHPGFQRTRLNLRTVGRMAQVFGILASLGRLVRRPESGFPESLVGVGTSLDRPVRVVGCGRGG